MNNRYKTTPLKKMAVYNTQKDHLIIREYGRNTQNLINHAKTIESREERQAYVEEIVKLIMSMHPHTRNVEDYRLKVWSHVLQMSNYELDVDLPDNIPNTKERRKPDRVRYPQVARNMRHYGQNVRTMIEKAKHMSDPDQQKAFIEVIGAYMKMSYKTWNRESVNDDVIFEEFERLAKKELSIPAGTNIDMLVAPRKRKTGGNTNSNARNKSNKSNSNKQNNRKKSNKPKSSSKGGRSTKNQRNNKKR